jgi:error-prone DNA polymerase
VPLFQEQAMQVAMVAAAFSATEGDQLRRAMATFKHIGGVNKFRDKLITGMIDNGYDAEFAERTFRQLSYGFPESHAASFALIAYTSSWMKCHHPDVFCAAILNAQPMGFYSPAQLVRDARQHGVEVRPIDVNASAWDCTPEPRNQNRSGWPAAAKSNARAARSLRDAAAVDGLDEALTVPAGRGGETKSGDGHDPREVSVPMGNHMSRLRIDEESIAVKARNFR